MADRRQRGRIHRNPGLAKLFRILQQRGRAGFYEGDVASALVAKSTSLGGTMTMADLASYSGQWVDVATTNYHGYEVSTLPPPAQTWATDEMLNILESCVPVWAPGQTLATLGPANPKYWHLVVEAKKLAFGDLYAYNGDPEVHLDASRPTAVETVRRVAVQPRQPGARVATGRVGRADSERRHDRALDGGPLREHGRVGEQSVFEVSVLA